MLNDASLTRASINYQQITQYMRLLPGAIRGNANFHRPRITGSHRSMACSTCSPMTRTWLTASRFHIRIRTWRPSSRTWTSCAPWSPMDPWNPSVIEDWVTSPPSISYMCCWTSSENWRVRRPCRIGTSIISGRSVRKQYAFASVSIAICKIIIYKIILSVCIKFITKIIFIVLQLLLC